MSEIPQREMTLEEYVTQLPPSHWARKELDQLLLLREQIDLAKKEDVDVILDLYGAESMIPAESVKEIVSFALKIANKEVPMAGETWGWRELTGINVSLPANAVMAGRVEISVLADPYRVIAGTLSYVPKTNTWFVQDGEDLRLYYWTRSWAQS